jgi:Uma2 family endonuclease
LKGGTALALHDRPVRLTYDDYLLFPEDGRRHEILDGEHYVTASPSLKHQTVSIRLSAAISTFVDAHRLGAVFAAPTDVLLSRHDIVVPDLVFISRTRFSILTEANIQGAPDLVVEILSPSTRRVDEGLKLARYESLGVQEYWVADPLRRTMTVHRLEGDHFRPAAILQADLQDVLTTPLIPGLEVRLAEVFAWDFA